MYVRYNLIKHKQMFAICKTHIKGVEMMNYKIKKLCTMVFVFVIFVMGFTEFVEKTSFQSNAAEKEFPIGYTSYVVRAGDSLWSIAQSRRPKEKESVEDFILEIKEINHLESDYIYDGQLIAVPCYDETAVVCAD